MAEEKSPLSDRIRRYQEEAENALKAKAAEEKIVEDKLQHLLERMDDISKGDDRAPRAYISSDESPKFIKALYCEIRWIKGDYHFSEPGGHRSIKSMEKILENWEDRIANYIANSWPHEQKRREQEEARRRSQETHEKRVQDAINREDRGVWLGLLAAVAFVILTIWGFFSE